MKTVSSSAKNLPNALKVALIIVAFSFLAYSIYWAAIVPFTSYEVWVFISGPVFQNSPMNTPLSVALLSLQEYVAAVGFVVNLIAAVLAFQSTSQYIKNEQKWQTNLGKALLCEAVFFLLFIPTVIHHMGGALISMAGTDFFVGISYLLQILLIVPPFIILGRKLKNHQSQASTHKWACITVPFFVFAFWFKYLFLWIDTFSPMGPQQVTVAGTVGALNSWLTLLIASGLMVFSCWRFYQTKKINKWLMGTALIVFGGYFVIYDLVAIWEPVYSWFFYVTDVWMITLPILGAAILKTNRPNP